MEGYLDNDVGAYSGTLCPARQGCSSAVEGEGSGAGRSLVAAAAGIPITAGLAADRAP
ncbi:hypothetical protein Aau02nite_04720 [Amorphoplanes auranticolor]|uniref:Uncharacterized protein n=1 Tax=Actinoplanes auranticolor TaxID=47988 RepID=A0A919VIE0_9ACTN|nr:hypothetical protein Aau02nite_04720 [Actinoplanes auranticolor]